MEPIVGTLSFTSERGMMVTLASALQHSYSHLWSQLLRCRHGRLRSLRLTLLHREFKTSLKGELSCLKKAKKKRKGKKERKKERKTRKM